MINLDPKLNPARYSAMKQALFRANREQKAMSVYVGPPGSSTVFKAGWPNVWFVRAADEPAPEGAELFHTQAPNSGREFFGDLI